jgi:hypothetical protein
MKAGERGFVQSSLITPEGDESGESLSHDTWTAPAFKADLNRLLSAARRGTRRIASAERPYQLVATSRGTYVLEAEALSLQRSLERRLVGSSRRSHGMSRKEARSLLRDACSQAVTSSISRAESAFYDALTEPITNFTVLESVWNAHLPSKPVRVGACMYAPEIPRHVGRSNMKELATERGVRPPVVYTRVRARGSEAAQALARERFAESAAFLDLIDPPAQISERVALIRRDRGTAAVAWLRGGWLIDDQWIDDSGRFPQPYRQLELGLRRDENDRQDWERRVIAACRWFSNGWRSDWASDRLVAYMSALECLFVPPKARTKGKTIARQITRHFRLNEYTEAEQIAWITKLYSGRSAAIHEGREFLEEMYVERLAELTREAIRGAARHLLSNHELHPLRACRDFQTAVSCPTWLAAAGEVSVQRSVTYAAPRAPAIRRARG